MEEQPEPIASLTSLDPRRFWGAVVRLNHFLAYPQLFQEKCRSRGDLQAHFVPIDPLVSRHGFTEPQMSKWQVTT